MRRRVDGRGVERFDDGVDSRREGVGGASAEVELVTRIPPGGTPSHPRRGARAGSSAAGPATPSAARGTAPRSRNRQGHDRRAGPKRDQRGPGGTGRAGPAGPLIVPSGICTNTAPASTTARAERTWLSTPRPPRHTGSRPPRRWTSHSRQRDVNVEGPLPRNQQRGSSGQCVHGDERDPSSRDAPGDQQVAALRQVLLPGGLDPESEDAEQNEAGDEADESVQRARRAPRAPTQPVETFRAPPRAAASASGRSRGRVASAAATGLGHVDGPLVGRLRRGLRRRPAGPRRAPPAALLVELVESSLVGLGELAERPTFAGGTARGRRALAAPDPEDAMPMTTNPAPKIWAVGMSARRQLPMRRNSSRKRTAADPDEA